MLPQIDIENLLRVEGTDADNLESTLASLKEVLTAECDQLTIQGNDLRFHTEWEPPFKALKAWTKEHPKAVLTLWADAFARHHWVLKADIQNGKSNEETLSRIDDDFYAVFQEIYGCSFEEWEKQPRQPFGA